MIRQIADLLWEYERVTLPLPRMVPLAYREALRLQCYLERQLKNTWDWLVTVMDATEAQLRYLFFLFIQRFHSQASCVPFRVWNVNFGRFFLQPAKYWFCSLAYHIKKLF